MSMKLTFSSKKFLILVLALFVASLLNSCDTKRTATGNEDEIFVVADSSEYEELKSTLQQVFGKIIYTPQPEPLFTLTRKDYYQIESVKNKKNVVFVAPLNSDSKVSQYIEDALDSSVTQRVNENEEFVFNKYDLWAANQLVMFLTSPTTEDLEENILSDQENLLYHFQNISNKRLYKSLYNKKFERKEIEGQFLRDYGWIIYVQADYLLAKNEPEDNFVWIRRAPGTNMERWIFVHWIENASPEYLNADSICAIRDSITSKYYLSMDEKNYVKIADDYKMSAEVNFNGRYAIMTQGLWEMDEPGMMGGPFVNYTFYDEDSKRLYMLDGSIYAPKYYKKKLIQQVDVTLQSFMTEDEISEDKKENLLDALEE